MSLANGSQTLGHKRIGKIPAAYLEGQGSEEIASGPILDNHGFFL